MYGGMPRTYEKTKRGIVVQWNYFSNIARHISCKTGSLDWSYLNKITSMNKVHNCSPPKRRLVMLRKWLPPTKGVIVQVCHFVPVTPYGIWPWLLYVVLIYRYLIYTKLLYLTTYHQRSQLKHICRMMCQILKGIHIISCSRMLFKRSYWHLKLWDVII